MQKVIFWQNSPSIHQVAYIRKLAEIYPGSIYVVSEKPLSQKRIYQGWSQPDFRPAQLALNPTRKERKSIIDKNSDSINIFSGICSYPETYWTLKQTAKQNQQISIMSEAFNSSRIFGRVSNNISNHCFNRFRKHIRFVLPIGELAKANFINLRFTNDYVFPFGYFVAPPFTLSYTNKSNSQSMIFAFVGQLIKRKGIDLLFKAISRLTENFTLRIFGSGNHETQLRRLAASLHIDHCIEWYGALPNENIREQLQQADYLILPSRFDGWGAVVNESLSCGTPVIVSSSCGASDLVQEDWLGYTFTSGSIEALSAILSNVLQGGPIPIERRKRISSWAQKAISPEAAADYFVSIINFVNNGSVKPFPPWHPKTNRACDSLL